MEARIREHVRLARLFASWLERDARFEVLAPVTMGVVCFRAVPTESVDAAGSGEEASNDFNRRLVEAVNATGRAYLTHTTLRGGRVAARLAVGNVLTTERHLSEVYELLRRLASA
jgi:aromatic-L-amino-acid decarboxylase